MSRRPTVMADKMRWKRNKPPADEPWIWLTRTFLECEAWRTAPINTRRVVERLMLEHCAHAGTENGNLICTYRDFEKFGVGRRHIAGAIADAAHRGLISITQKGKASSGDNRRPSKYALGWLPMHDGAPAANRWKGWTKPKPHPAPIPVDIYSTIRRDGRGNGPNPIPSPSEGMAETPSESGAELLRRDGRGKIALVG